MSEEITVAKKLLEDLSHQLIEWEKKYAELNEEHGVLKVAYNNLREEHEKLKEGKLVTAKPDYTVRLENSVQKLISLVGRVPIPLSEIRTKHREFLIHLLSERGVASLTYLATQSKESKDKVFHRLNRLVNEDIIIKLGKLPPSISPGQSKADLFFAVGPLTPISHTSIESTYTDPATINPALVRKAARKATERIIQIAENTDKVAGVLPSKTLKIRVQQIAFYTERIINNFPVGLDNNSAEHLATLIESLIGVIKLRRIKA